MFIDGREQLMPAAGGARTYHLPEGDVECVYTIHSEQATLPAPTPTAASAPSSGGSACRPRTRCRCARSWPRAWRRPIRCSSTAARCARATCSSPCSPARAARPTTPDALERLRAHVVGTSGGARVEIDADLPLAQHAEWGTDSGTYSTGVPPSIAAQLLAGGQALRTGVGGPEVIIPVAAFFAALATPRHARRDQRAPPARLTHPRPRAAGILGAREKWPSG